MSSETIAAEEDFFSFNLIVFFAMAINFHFAKYRFCLHLAFVSLLKYHKDAILLRP